MADLLLQVTIASTGVAQQVSKSLPAASRTGPELFDPQNTFAQQIIFQNDGTNAMRLGDTTVTATRGLVLSASGSANFGAFINYGTFLSDWWVVGTAGDVLTVVYIK